MSRVLETILVGRNLLSPVLAQAGRDVVAFNSTVAGANAKAATTATTAAQVQDRAADKITASNVKASTSATASTQAQTRAHTRAAESATVSARVQQTANSALIRSNGLLGTSLTPLTAGLGGTALALGYAGYRGMEFDKSMSRVQAATQATAGTMGDLRDAAVDAGAKTQFSASEAAGGITEMAKAGVDARDIIGGGLTGALNLAAAGEMDVADAAEIGATALNVFNLKGDQMTHVADLLAAGAGKAQGSVHDLGMALNQSALVASATGLSIEETTGTLAAFASAGLIGSDAGTSFRSMLLHLQNPSKEAAGVMESLGINMYDANGAFVGMESLAGQLSTQMKGLTQAERDKAMATIFGSDAVRAANVLYEQGAAGIETWTGKVNDAGYAAKQAADLNNNLAGDLEKLGGAVDSFFTSAGAGAQGPLREVVQALTFLVGVGGDVLGFFNSLPAPVGVALLALGAVVALKGPLVGALESIGGALTGVAGRTIAATSSMTAFKAAGSGLVGAMGGPLGVALAAGTVLIVGITSSLQKAEEQTDAWTQALIAGGDSAAKVAAEAQAIRDKQPFDWMADLDEWTGFAPSLDEATEAAKRHFATLDPIAQAQAKVSEWTSTLSTRIETLGTGHENTAIAQERLAYWTDLLGDRQGNLAAATEVATGTTAANTAATEEAAKAQEKWLETVQGVLGGYVEPLAVYTGLLEEKTEAERLQAEETAAATESSKDSWKDYVGDVSLSLDEYAAKLEEKILNQQNWRDNIVKVTGWAGEEVGQILLAMGEEGVDIVAKMADGGSAESRRLADALIADAHAGGAGAAAELDTQMRIMAAVGAAGSKATVQGIAAELGVGAEQVRRIASQFGVNLAEGIDPLLAALGKPGTAGRMASAQSLARQRGLSEGGYTGDGGKYTPAGIVHAGEIVWSQDDIAAHGGVDRVENMRRTRAGYAAGGFVSAADVPSPYSTAPYRAPLSTAGDATMQKGFDEVRAWLAANAEATQGGTAGTGSLAGGGWQAIFNYVKAIVPQARVNSAYRPGDPGRHGLGLAVDFGFGTGPGGAGSAGLASINRVLHDGIGSSLRELIYDGIGDDRPDLYGGKPHTYSRATQLQHANHVHAARADGGPFWPGQNFLVGENGPEIARFDGGTGYVYATNTAPAAMPGYATAPAAMPGYATAPAAMPGYGMGGWGNPQAATPVAVSLAGATITGRFEFGSDGMVTLVDGRINGRLEDLYRQKVRR